MVHDIASLVKYVSLNLKTPVEEAATIVLMPVGWHVYASSCTDRPLLRVVNDFTPGGSALRCGRQPVHLRLENGQDLAGVAELVVAFGPNAGPYNGSQAVFNFSFK